MGCGREKSLRLKVDYREAEDVFRALKNVGATPIRSTLPLSDITTDKVIIEFKRARDLIDSVVTGRIFSQCERMAKDGRIPWVLIAGTVEEVELRQRTRIKEIGFWGAIGSLSYRYGVNVIWVDHPLKGGGKGLHKAMYIAHKICKGVDEGKYGKPHFVRKREKRMPKGVKAIRTIFGVPRKTAYALHKKFKNLAGVCQATKRQLRTIPGIGEVRANLIYAIART